jgi:hypothetical protein
MVTSGGWWMAQLNGWVPGFMGLLAAGGGVDSGVLRSPAHRGWCLILRSKKLLALILWRLQLVVYLNYLQQSPAGFEANRIHTCSGRIGNHFPMLA